MTGIRCQLTRITIGVILALFITIIAFSRTVFLDGYRAIEQRLMENDLKRATDAITFRLKELERTAIDWSAWDDTYRFVVDRNQQYINANIPDKSMAGIDVNLMMFLDQQNRPVHKKWISLQTQQESSPPNSLPEITAVITRLMQSQTNNEGVRGVLLLPEGPLLVAARPILTSNFTGPARGTFIVGRLLDDSLIAFFKRQTQLDVRLVPSAADINHNRTPRITTEDTGIIRGEQVIDDMLGRPAIMLQVTGKREIFAMGREAATDITILLLLAGSVIGFTMYYYGEKGIVRHLIRMSSCADQIAQNGDISQRLEVGGARELERFGKAVNNMLDSLESAQRDLLESELKNRSILQNSSDAIILYDLATDRIQDANDAFFKITGYTNDDLHHLSLRQFVRNPERMPTLTRICRRRTHISLSGVNCTSKNGNLIELDISISLIRIKERETLSCIMRDMTLRNREQRMIRELAITDPLTCIANRRHLLDRGRQEFERLKRDRLRKSDNPTLLGCIMLDIDNFKAINDTRGHHCGDQVLKEIGQRLIRNVRPYDVPGRYGGEEFLVFVIDSSGEQTRIVAERIWQSIRSAPFYSGAHSFTVTASLGISFLHTDDDSIEELLNRADTALYVAKQSGRDQIRQIT